MRPNLSASLRRFGWLAPALVLAAVWAPIWNHYRIPRSSISPDLVERARTVPPDSVLAELEGARFSARRWSDQPDLLPIAERLLRGEAAVPGLPTTTVHLPFDAGDVQRGPSSWQLEVASLIVPEILLAAYEKSGREEYFVTARDVIRGWANYERRAHVPRGFLWNDHALASRVVVLGHFWRLYRQHRSYDPVVARSVLEFALRSGRFLAAPAQFTFATNHGVMQNLGLWHLAVAFPWMPDRDSMRRVAFRRLEEQFHYYVDSQGVILEHSAEYQAFGVELMGMALRYLTLMGEPAPREWIRKYEAAKDVYRLMRRPDGTLPLLGDTDSRPQPHVPLVTTVDAAGWAAPLKRSEDWSPGVGGRLFPTAGYAIWWDGPEGDRSAAGGRQTLVTWSNVPGHGHKHADELSVLLWGDGQSWWTNAGYWSYDLSGRGEAVSWTGSNAPHLLDEPGQSPRDAHLLGYGESDRMMALDLERTGPGAYRARRQIVHLRPDIWLVLDQTQGDEDARTTTAWTTSPEVALIPGDLPGTYVLTSEGSPTELRAAIESSQGTSARLLRGSVQPFAGWVVRHGVPTASTSIVLDQAARHAWTLSVWRLARGGGSDRDGSRLSSSEPDRPGTLEVNYQGPENWDVTLSPWLGAGSVRREGAEVLVRTAPRGGAPEAITLAPFPPDSAEIESMEKSLARMASAYPKFRDHLAERYGVTGWILAGLIVQELLFFALRRRRASIELPLRGVALMLWIIGGVWLVGAYLGS